MFLHVHAGQAIHMADKEVRKPDDLKGLKMRIPTRTGAWIIEALGAAAGGACRCPTCRRRCRRRWSTARSSPGRSFRR